MDNKGFDPIWDSVEVMEELKTAMNKNRERFEAFHKSRPDVYAEFCKRVNQLWDRGRRHYSADGILHIVRFHSVVDGRPEDEFKINNSFSAFYARLWQQENQDRKEFFTTRIQKAAQ